MVLVKPRSTVWFSRVVVEDYDDHVVALFKMPKEFGSQCGVITKASYST